MVIQKIPCEQEVTGSISATGFKVPNGTSNQILMADGSVRDINTISGGGTSGPVDIKLSDDKTKLIVNGTKEIELPKTNFVGVTKVELDANQKPVNIGGKIGIINNVIYTFSDGSQEKIPFMLQALHSKNVFTKNISGGFSNNPLTIVTPKELLLNSDKVYIKGVGGYTNGNYSTSKSIQDIINQLDPNADQKTLSVGSIFNNGNVTIPQNTPWTFNNAYPRIYKEFDLKQGDKIQIPEPLRMFIGYKTPDGTYGQANWATANKEYTAPVDGKYVVLVATNNDTSGLTVDQLPQYGEIKLTTSNKDLYDITEVKTDHTKDDKIMKSIAHQGYHRSAKANSLKAFEAAGKNGWNYVETDIYKTSDNHWVVGHDAWMPEGYTNGTITIASGDRSYKYEEHTLAEIQAFTHPTNDKIATLEDFCKVCKRYGLHPYIEIKSPLMGGKQTGVGDKYDDKPYIHKALDIIRREGLGKNFTIISSGNWNLEETVKYDNAIRVGYINVFEMYNVNTTDKKYWDTTVLNLTKIINAGGGRAVYLFLDQNLMHIPTCPAENIDWLIDHKIPLEVWTANDQTNFKDLHSYITGVTSDNVHAGEVISNFKD